MNRLWMPALAATALALTACGGGTRALQTEATAPTVSYSYNDASGYEEVFERAEDYCDDEFGRDAVLLSRDLQGDRYHATFACQ